MNNRTVQIQSVLYNNEKWALKRALDSVKNAVRVNRGSGYVADRVTVCYGDASREPIFSEEDVLRWQQDYSEFFDFKYIFFNENTGSAKGHNKIAETCISEYMVIMNPDVIVCPVFFEKMMKPFIEDAGSTVGMTEARQTPVEHPKRYDRSTLETDWAATACAMFKTSDFRALNGFDSDTFFLYCDDLDFSWRMRLLSKKILYIPDCPVFHSKNLSSSGEWQPTSAEVYYSAEAALLMAYKWSNKKRFELLYNQFKNSGNSINKKAVEHFDELKKAGRLPKQLDKEQKVARFVGDCYTEHRFNL